MKRINEVSYETHGRAIVALNKKIEKAEAERDAYRSLLLTLFRTHTACLPVVSYGAPPQSVDLKMPVGY